MAVTNDSFGKRTDIQPGLRDLFNTEINIRIRVLSILAMAGAVGNTLGFLANLVLYGFNFVTGFCAFCAVLILLNLFFGIRSRYRLSLGYAMLFLLDVLEFPLLLLTYGAVMLPYLIIGFHALVMISRKKRRVILCALLGIYDVALIVYSTLHPYIFGPQEAAGLLGSAVVTFVISLLTVVGLVDMLEGAYLAETRDVDYITKVLSQPGFIKSAEKILKSDSREDYLILYFNVCSFKAVNAIYDIDGGNAFLRQLAAHLRTAPFSPRLVGRINSDHFVCLVAKKNLRIADLESVCRIPFDYKNRQITVSLTCSIYEITDRTLSVSSMCDRASAALFHLHSSGNNCYTFYNAAAEVTYQQETEVLGDIEQAINERQFQPYFQPIVDCRTGRVVCAEALARWIHPEMGTIPPARFIPVLEKKGMISRLDIIMAEKVSALLKYRLENSLPMVPISLNLSREDLLDREMMESINRMVHNAGTKDNWYHIEITESVYENMSEHTLNILSQLRKSGAQILVDDFGNGYSSLGSITDYEFDVIKLDMSFARKINNNERVYGIVQSLIDMSHKLGAKVVAEGVETEEQFLAIRDCGCDYIQGYYFFKPLPEKDFLTLLDTQK